RSLTLRADAVVRGPAGEACRVPAEVGILEHVPQEARGQLQADREHPGHEQGAFGLREGDPGGAVPCPGCGKQADVEARLARVLPERIAPGAPRVPEPER